MNSRRPEILFLCVRNAGRSQMAARFAEAMAGGAVVVRSAGSEPAASVHPAVADAMAEIGLGLDGRAPARLSDDGVRAADVVVTMGCGETCPYFPGRRYVDWPVDDPSGRDPDAVRRIRDDIRARVEDLLRDLGIAPAPL